MNTRRICHFTTVHPRNDIRILLKECGALARVGYAVHLIVGDGLGDAQINGIHVHDIGAKPRSRIKRMWVQPKRALEKILAIQPDIVHFHDPELLPVGVKLSKKGFRTIYDVHEDVPRQILDKYWIPSGIRLVISKLFEFYENHSVRKLSGVIAATPFIESRFSEQGLKVINVNNYPLLEEVALNEDGGIRQKDVCYIGVISRMRGALQIVRALPLVPDVRLRLCGEIREPGLEAELRAEQGWSQVDYLGYVDRDAVKHTMAKSFAGLVTFLPAPNHLNAQPNKIFEYMASSLPVIASKFPLWKQIIDESGCGICVDPESHKAIAEAIRKLLDSPADVAKMGHSGRQTVLNKYNWMVEAQKMLDFYRTLL